MRLFLADTASLRGAARAKHSTRGFLVGVQPWLRGVDAAGVCVKRVNQRGGSAGWLRFYPFMLLGRRRCFWGGGSLCRVCVVVCELR